MLGGRCRAGDRRRGGAGGRRGRAHHAARFGGGVGPIQQQVAHHPARGAQGPVEVRRHRVHVAELEREDGGADSLHDVIVDLERVPTSYLPLAEARRQLLARRLGENPIGDVDTGAAHPDRRAVVVLDHDAVRRQVAHLAVGPHDSLGDGPAPARLVDLPVRGRHRVAVVGVHHRQEPVVRRVELLRFVAVDAIQLVRPRVRVAVDVPVVVAHVGELLGRCDPGLEVGELLTGRVELLVEPLG